MAKDPKKTEPDDDDEYHTELSIEAARAMDERLTWNIGDLTFLNPEDRPEDEEGEDESPEVEAARNYGGAPGERSDPAAKTVLKK